MILCAIDGVNESKLRTNFKKYVLSSDIVKNILPRALKLGAVLCFGSSSSKIDVNYHHLRCFVVTFITQCYVMVKKQRDSSIWSQINGTK